MANEMMSKNNFSEMLLTRFRWFCMYLKHLLKFHVLWPGWTICKQWKPSQWILPVEFGYCRSTVNAQIIRLLRDNPFTGNVKDVQIILAHFTARTLFSHRTFVTWWPHPINHSKVGCLLSEPSRVNNYPHHPSVAVFLSVCRLICFTFQLATCI